MKEWSFLLLDRPVIMVCKIKYALKKPGFQAFSVWKSKKAGRGADG